MQIFGRGGQGETQQSTDPNQYDWDFQYHGPETGHVALITMDVAADLIDTVIPPPGWICLNPADPQHQDFDYPFYQGYAEDGAPAQPPWNPAYTAPLAFRALDEASTLSIMNATAHITLFTVGATRGSIRVWAGGDAQVLEGPVAAGGIPILSEWGAVTMFLILLVAGTIVIGRIRTRQAA